MTDGGIRQIDTRIKRKLDIRIKRKLELETVTEGDRNNKGSIIAPYTTTKERSKMSVFKDALVEKARGLVQDFIEERMLVQPSQYSRGRYWAVLEEDIRGMLSEEFPKVGIEAESEEAEALMETVLVDVVNVPTVQEGHAQLVGLSKEGTRRLWKVLIHNVYKERNETPSGVSAIVRGMFGDARMMRYYVEGTVSAREFGPDVVGYPSTRGGGTRGSGGGTG